MSSCSTTTLRAVSAYAQMR
uniref:Uncharacterized protein n=1 Tax=Anguilla anguilla TaxID=7936 RepID=A0A0E9UMY9_ANGAN